jgi:hypothetical protein
MLSGGKAKLVYDISSKLITELLAIIQFYNTKHMRLGFHLLFFRLIQFSQILNDFFLQFYAFSSPSTWPRGNFCTFNTFQTTGNGKVSVNPNIVTFTRFHLNEFFPFPLEPVS